MDAKLFGQRLKAARDAKGVSQEDVARATHGMISRVAVSNWERGEAKTVQAEALALVSRYLDTTPDHLLFGTARPRAPIEDIDQAWPMLTPDQRLELAELAKAQAAQNAAILEALGTRK
jgi:transcriptional regulator with XRE-family HTH domain